MNGLILAKIEEADECARLLESGRQFQLSQGFVQWTEEYPTIKDVKADIAESTGYVYKVDGEIAAYMCIKDDEPVYNQLNDVWGNKGPYIVIHRMGLSDKFRGRGLSAEIFDALAVFGKNKGMTSIRIDTHGDNKRMQHVLVKCGFTFRGNVIYEFGARLAYDRLI